VAVPFRDVFSLHSKLTANFFENPQQISRTNRSQSNDHQGATQTSGHVERLIENGSILVRSPYSQSEQLAALAPSQPADISHT
jgi:hypothetical protein